jgi:hypothetical protein
MVTIAERLMSDERFYIESLVEIPDREGQTRQFIYNPAQELLHEKHTGRDVVVKASQLGITTFYLAKGLKLVLSNPNMTGVVVAHEDFLTQRLLTRLQFMYDSIPSKVKPAMHHASSYEKTFPGINSTFYIGTAGAKVFGRGEPIHFFLGSEVGFWPDAWKILTPTLQRVPLSGQMILESTPHGTGDPDSPDNSRHNAFYDIVQEALNDPDTFWKLHVLNWWLEPSYRLPINSPHAAPSDRGHLDYSAEEEDLCRKAGWDDLEAEERIRWRRRKIREIRHMFWQEFMEDLASCFLVSGEGYYDMDELERMRQSCYPAPDSFRNAQIWYKPIDSNEHPLYTIAVDPGQGKVTRSVATVWRHDLENFEVVQHVATLSGYYEPVSFAAMVMELGEYYHHARIDPEANGHGMSFCSEIRDYGNVYYRTDVISGISTKAIGWYTSGAARINGRGTKPYMMTELQSDLPNMECHDINIIGDLMQVRLAGDVVKFLTSADFHDSAAIMSACRGGLIHSGQRGFIGTSGWGRQPRERLSQRSLG